MKVHEDEWMHNLVNKITDSYKEDWCHGLNSSRMPNKDEIIKIIALVKKVLFPGYFADPGVNTRNIDFFVGDLLSEILFALTREIEKSILASTTDIKTKGAAQIARAFIETLPRQREMMKKDVKAAFSGDPAASSSQEIISSYPCVDIIFIHRMAHELFNLETPLIPRIMSEYAHSITGADIHPGAKIGEYFFIDHATGVVIGETCEIGDNVKIYQGVTLGALSFPRDDKGSIIKGLKRHPTIKDNVTIYANATILGGDTIIGDGAVIGGNAWITESVEPGEKILRR